MKKSRTVGLLAPVLFLLAILAVPAAEAEEGLEIGSQAPLFRALDDTGTRWDFKDHVGQRYWVIYFYPAAMTSGCTAQACSFRDSKSDLDSLGIGVVGISGDEWKNLEIFKKENGLNFKLLSDPDGKIAKAFGVPLRDGGSIKRTVSDVETTLRRGVTASRWTFILDKKGLVIYKNTEVNPSQDSAEVVRAVRGHRESGE